MMAATATENEPLHPKLLELYRRAAPAQKLAVVAQINASLQAVKAAQLKSARPELSAAAQTRELRRWWFAARD